MSRRMCVKKTSEQIVSRFGDRLCTGVGMGTELIPILGSQPAGDVSHRPGGRLPLLSAIPAVRGRTEARRV